MVVQSLCQRIPGWPSDRTKCSVRFDRYTVMVEQLQTAQTARPEAGPLSLAPSTDMTR